MLGIPQGLLLVVLEGQEEVVVPTPRQAVMAAVLAASVVAAVAAPALVAQGAMVTPMSSFL